MSLIYKTNQLIEAYAPSWWNWALVSEILDLVHQLNFNLAKHPSPILVPVKFLGEIQWYPRIKRIKINYSLSGRLDNRPPQYPAISAGYWSTLCFDIRPIWPHIKVMLNNRSIWPEIQPVSALLTGQNGDQLSGYHCKRFFSFFNVINMIE